MNEIVGCLTVESSVRATDNWTMADRGFVDECIKAINDYRRSHQVSPLTHNQALSTIAQQWADHIARSSSGSIGHNPNASYRGEPLGENCAFRWYSDGRDVTGRPSRHQRDGDSTVVEISLTGLLT